MSGNKQNVNRIPQDELAMRSILKDMGVTGTVKELEIVQYTNSLVVFHTYTFFLQIPCACPPFLEYERRVVQQMLEYAYRYTTEILEEARVYSNHTKHKRV